jgi:hypothetical protein
MHLKKHSAASSLTSSRLFCPVGEFSADWSLPPFGTGLAGKRPDTVPLCVRAATQLAWADASLSGERMTIMSSFWIIHLT